MTPEEVAEIKADIKRAHTEVGEICQRTGAGRWRMSIPARPDRDSDLLISRALTHADALVAEVERQAVRLKAAEDLCVMYTWSPVHTDTAREKAAFELWSRWYDLVGEAFIQPEAHPDLGNKPVARLAAQRDETRARTLAKIRSDAPTELPGGEG